MDELKNILKDIIRNNISADAWTWLENEALSLQSNGDIPKFNIAFVAMPRKTGKGAITFTQGAKINMMRPGFSIGSWTADRLTRVWLLMHLKSGNKEKYIAAIENLFLNAEMSELVALYSALPVLAYQEAWQKRCAEGIRSNIGQVLESIICDNPYPAEQLDEAAFNQLVLKAIFTEKPILRISGLQKRLNRNLSKSLSDYAHERWAAHRAVNPLLWMCVTPFIDENIFHDIRQIFSSENPVEREAAALACHESNYAPGKKLLEEDMELKEKVKRGEVSWSTVDGRQSTVHG
jgi:hypothetical protein